MKVLHLGKLCPPNEGGIEVFSFDLLEALNEKDIRADLLCFGVFGGPAKRNTNIVREIL
jgi:N-acetyllactosaminide 3-alpha-galactosyltransferase/rhamnosyl/mannosyltransferase